MKTVLPFLLCIFFFSCICAQKKNSLGMELVKIPAGTFYMGNQGIGESFDEAPAHVVTLSSPFLMGTTEVTNIQYEVFDPSHKALRGKYGLSKEDDEAVVFVDYHEATAFCKWLSKKEGKTYRLPTEAEWEYACKAHSYSKFSMNDALPQNYQKKQYTVWGIDTTVNLKVGTTPPNAFGLHDMHGNVEEWCSDWYGLYESHAQTNPVGRIDGIYKVTRGGSHSTPVHYLSSTNRMAMIPEDKHWLTGFRVVQAEIPSTPPLPMPNDPYLSTISSQKYNWETPRTEPFFAEPVTFVKALGCNSHVPFYAHNHCPAVTWCDNGDLLAIWFSTNDEIGREMTILSSRLREGETEWEEPQEFLRIPDRNLTGSSLFHDTENGTLIHINGVEVAGSWQKLAMLMRTSRDNGATWSRPQLIAPEHALRNQVIAGLFKTKEGWLVQAADATPGGEGGSALHLSKDNGKTWTDEGKDLPSHFTEGGNGGTIAGIHAGVIQLSNGDLMAFGRGNSIMNKEGLERMPMSLSKDHGRTWTYTASEFPPIDGGQRLVVMRLREGPLLLISFTHHPYRLKNGIKGMTFKTKEGKTYTGYGMFAALSFDEGKTWPVKKLLTDGKTRYMDGGAWTGLFVMNDTLAEPRGYLAATQTPDRVIHLLSSKNHYRFNLSWLLKDNEYPIHQPPLGSVEINNGFWKDRINLNSQVTLPDVLEKCQTYGRIRNFAVAAGLQKGRFTGGASWDDSDLYKALEAASYEYRLHKNEKLRLYMDSVISLLQKAQEEDGYMITVMRINKEKNLPWNIRSPRLSYLIWSHELYNFGHLHESAVAHYQATGQNNLLNVAIRNADLLVRTFLQSDTPNQSVDGHPEVESGLLKLWKVTGKPEYLLLVQKLLSLRGDSTTHPLYLEYDHGKNPYFFQDYKPIKEYDEAYGHGVRALYLYASMTDMEAYSSGNTYAEALQKLWYNITKYKMYLTGGIGSRHKGEAFGENYELPNAEAYNETCSSIANILWNHKMFKSTGKAKYMDICERILYNAFLAGWGQNGQEYNYVNPLESDGKYGFNHGKNTRQPWFETSCCPTNITRFIPQITQMIYATSGNNLYVNLFIPSSATFLLEQNEVQIAMNGNYPWDEDLTLSINPKDNSHPFSLYIRIPAWTGDTPLPESNLYEYLTSPKDKVHIRINGKTVSGIQTKDGYAILTRNWKQGDRVTLHFPMPVRYVKAHPYVEASQGKIAVERGPIVYCAEETDNPSLNLLRIASTSHIKSSYTPHLLGGIHSVSIGKWKLIPYYTWGNRGATAMKVWLPYSKD